MNNLIDTHCHIDLYPSPEIIIKEAESNRIYTIAVTNAPSVFFHTKELTRACQFVRPAVGLHPELVRSHGSEVENIGLLITNTRFIGEVGLDYMKNAEEDKKRQREIFLKIIEKCAEYGDKILTVHSRRAATDVIAAIGNRFPGKVILHWFSGSIKDLRVAIGYGMYFSINPAMVLSTNGRKIIKEIPRERILTETDGPFVQVEGEPARPAHVANAVAYLATAWKMPMEETCGIVAKNFMDLVDGNF